MTASDPASGRLATRAEQPASRFNRAVFWVFKLVVGSAFRVYFRLRVENAPRLEGGYVVAANHTSFLDPIFLGAACPRRVTFMMTALVFRSALMGWFYRFQRAIPLRVRGGNRDALRTARTVLNRGEVLGIFPEGGISRDGQLLRGNPGAVALGLAGKVPIIPVAIVGAYEAFRPGMLLPRPRKVRVIFGDPIDVDSLEGAEDRRARLDIATRAIMQNLSRLTRTTNSG